MKKRHIFWGVFFVLAAVLVIASQFGFFGRVGAWSIILGVLLIAWLIHGIFRISFIEITLPLALLYLVFQKPLKLFYLSPWLLILAAVLLGIGLSMLIRKRRRPPWTHGESGGQAWENTGGAPGHGGLHPETGIAVNDDDSYPAARVSFGATSRYLHAQNLVRGEFSASFGAMEIYFDQTKLAPAGADVFLECSFGSIRLFVPRGWEVNDNVTATLGTVQNDVRHAHAEEGLPPLNLSGSVSFGSIEVIYV